MTDPEKPDTNSMTVAEVTGLVQLFNNSLLAMEGRLTARIDDHGRLSADRWTKHEAQHIADTDMYGRRIVARFEQIERSLLKVETALEAHLAAEHDDELILDARVRPIKTVGLYVAKNWKTILLVVVSVLAVLGFSFETLDRLHLGL